MSDKIRQNALLALQKVRDWDVQADRDIRNYIDILEAELNRAEEECLDFIWKR